MSTVPFDLPFPSDRVLEGLAREVITNASADHYLSERFKVFGEALTERRRLAHELHDGLLQSMTGAALQLEAALRLIDVDAIRAREQIRETQELIVERQRELRAWIDSVRHPESRRSPHVDLVSVLQRLCQRVSRWGPRVELDAPDLARVPAAIADHVYRLVEEGLSNVTRHARAHVAHVRVRVTESATRIIIADDGCGFPFRGRYDLEQLDARAIGPLSLRERVTSLGGKLLLTSTLSGSSIDIELPSSMQRASKTFNPLHSKQRQAQS